MQQEQKASQEAQETYLEYSSIFSRWQGEQELPEGGIVLVWMDMATMLRYVDAYLQGQGHTDPTYHEREAALVACRKVSYWMHLAKTIIDPQVHMRRLGGTHPGDYHGE